MARRLVLLALATGAAFAVAPAAHAEEVCVTHDLRPTVEAAGVFCVDTNDPNFIRCFGILPANGHYFCA